MAEGVGMGVGGGGGRCTFANTTRLSLSLHGLVVPFLGV